MTDSQLSPKAKSTLKIVFLTLFLDLIGFSIIFPLFPKLVEHYLKVDQNNVFLKGILSFSAYMVGADPSEFHYSQIVLFGGVLAGIYSLLQFLFAPFWGKLSDRIGRKPILILSLSGIALSYVVWFFAGSFSLLILGRLIGGIMAGNISTATAIVGDVTSSQNRSKGMAIIGIAFGLGFILGPALGGFSTLWNLHLTFPSVAGINPFSSAALVALILTLINLFSVIVRFDESLPKEKRGTAKTNRTANIAKIFKPLPYAGVNLANFANFFFLFAFAGMEFTLTFLAHERLNFTPIDNAVMFVFTGFLIALVQGGFVRRRAHSIGEKKVALMGLCFLAPGMILIGLAHSVFFLYAGLAFTAMGSAMIIPCLTALVSLYTPADSQGHSLGIFRSLGALARVLGPLFACLIYWRFGSHFPYFGGTLILVIPFLLLTRLNKTKDNDERSDLQNHLTTS